MKQVSQLMTQAVTNIIKPYSKFKVENEIAERAMFISDLKIAGNKAAKMLGKNFEFVIDDNNLELVVSYGIL